MKRRNVDNAKIRRTLKKNKISDGLCGGSLIYLKLLLVWALVMTADFLLEFRFEYLWPFWLLLRSIYDSFRYQGVAFSVFFVCVTVTSDMICFLFIPVQWLFFLASTYVWVQYVWHADRGVCLPTVSLWLLFIYVEASIRLKELKSVPFTLDLCRPFAAHCIGYPVVTLGFGVKSYVSYRMRMRKQREVARVNETYTRLLAESLSVEQRLDGEIGKHRYLTSQVSSEDLISNGALCGSQQHLSAYGSSQAVVLANHNNVAVSTTVVRQSTKNWNAASSLPKKSSVPSAYSTGSSSLNYMSPMSSNHANGSVGNNSSNLMSHYTANGNGGGNVDVEDDDDYSADNMDAASWILNAIKSRLFGVCSPASASGSNGSPSSTAVDTSSSSWFYNSWSSSMLHDSDDESRESKDSRESAAGPGVGAECQLVKRFNSATSGLGAGSGGKHKLKRRGYGVLAAAGAPATPTSPSGGALGQQQQPVETAIAKDHNTPQPLSENKEKVQDKDLYLSLESDIEKLKTELRSSRGREQELRNQIQQLNTSDKSVKSELQQLRQNNEQLQTRVQNLVRARQQDKQNMITMEKKLAEEQKNKSQVEQQLQQERKQKKAEEASRNAAAAAAANKADCGEPCKQRRRELEVQAKQLRRDVQQREEQLTQLENELRALRQYKEQHNTEILMSALSAMQEKNMHLESSLSAETRVKLDLFSALGEAKRQLEIAQNQLIKKEQELDDLRRRVSDMTGDMYMNRAATSTPQSMVPCSVVGMVSPLTPPPSTLDNAAMDLLGTAAYQTASYMTNLPGLFDEHAVRSEYGAMPMTAAGHGMPAPGEAAMRYSPPRSTSH